MKESNEKRYYLGDMKPNKPRNKYDTINMDPSPFQITNTESDRNISFYMVENGMLNQIGKPNYSFIFAPHGAGKTTLKLLLSKECRTNLFTSHVKTGPENNSNLYNTSEQFFALNYNLPSFSKFHNNEDNEIDIEQLHYSQLVRDASEQLLMSLASRPKMFFELDQKNQIRIKSFLTSNISTFYGEIKQLEKLGPNYLYNIIEPSMRSAVNTPKDKDVKSFCKLMNELPTYENNQSLSSKQQFTEFKKIIFDVLENKGLFISIDGVDAYPETEKDVIQGTKMINWLLTNTLEFESERIYLKYFLLPEYKTYLKEKFPSLFTQSEFKSIEIPWNDKSLSEIVYRRLWEASGRKFGSLKAISKKELRGLEETPEMIIIQDLISQIKGNPRDVLIKINNLLQSLELNPDEIIEKISQKHIDTILD